MRMAEHYTIGKLAGTAGIPTSTVRYYERRGLLLADGRTAGNYRSYGPGAVDRLRFIRSAQAAGFTLSDIRTLLQFQEGGGISACNEVQDLISARLTQVVEQLDHLKTVDRLLRQWLKVCRESEKTGRCGVLAGLSTGLETPQEIKTKKAGDGT